MKPALRVLAFSFIPAAVIMSNPSVAMAADRSGACASYACGSATVQTWAKTYAEVSESVSWTDCSVGNSAKGITEGWFKNGDLKDSVAVVDATCEAGKLVVKNHASINDGGSALVRIRFIVTAGNKISTGPWVNDPNM